MPDYVYKGSYPMVYPAEIGNGFEVHPAEGNPSTTAVGSTVFLHPGDTLTTAEPIPEHAWMEEVETKAPKVTDKPQEAPVTPAEPAATSEVDPAPVEPPAGESSPPK